MSRWLAVAVATWLAGAAPARAGRPEPCISYSVELCDGRSVFVMLSPLSPEVEARWASDPEKALALRKAYPMSGLYRKGTAEPAWVVGWYAYEWQLHVASDGRHLIRTGPARGHLTDAEIFSLYGDGQVIRTFTKGDLARPPILGTRSFVEASEPRREWFDDLTMTYTVETTDGAHHVFDVRTGERVKGESAFSAWFLGGGIAAVALGAAAWAVWLFRKAPRATRPCAHTEPEDWPALAFLCLFTAALWSCCGLVVMAVCRCLLEFALAGGSYLPIGARKCALLAAAHASAFALLWLPLWLALCRRPGRARRLITAALLAALPGYFLTGTLCVCLD